VSHVREKEKKITGWQDSQDKKKMRRSRTKFFHPVHLNILLFLLKLTALSELLCYFVGLGWFDGHAGFLHDMMYGRPQEGHGFVISTICTPSTPSLVKLEKSFARLEWDGALTNIQTHLKIILGFGQIRFEYSGQEKFPFQSDKFYPPTSRSCHH
jgi:hypothetical protein